MVSEGDIMFALLLLLWIIFNGRFTIEILIFGILISAAVCLFCSRFLGYSFKREFKLLKCLPDFIVYLLVLIIEIAKANLDVTRRMLSRKKVEPAIAHFHVTLKSRLARTILADSITLTPGTITVSMREDEFYVHCLDKSLSSGLDDSVFVKRLARMEEKLL